MQLDLTDEQKLLAETVETLLRKNYDAQTRGALLDSPDGWSRDMWRQYAELGLLGLGLEEQYGGTGPGVTEIAVVMEAFGRNLVLEPYLPTILLAAQLVSRTGSAEQQKELLPRIAQGGLIMAWAHTERNGRWHADPITRAEQAGDGWRLSGEKIVVVGGDSAEQLVVTARRPDRTTGLFLVDGDATRRRPYRMHDGQRGADVLLDRSAARELGDGDTTDAADAIEAVMDCAIVALCAEAVGAMSRMLDLTVDYLKTREQFGRPIGGFQTLQHRAADMYVSLEQARSMALLARLAAVGPTDARRRASLRAAKIQVDLAARHIGQDAVQLHGGIGMTDEYPVGHYFKRTTVIARTVADVDELTIRLGEQSGLIPAG